jgi:hypothetical protein
VAHRYDFVTFCDCEIVTIIFARRHGMNLQKCKRTTNRYVAQSILSLDGAVRFRKEHVDSIDDQQG